jgi:pilus assembly protein CpaE
MSTIQSLFQRNKPGSVAADFVAFVSDPQTEQVLKNFVLDEAMPHVHVAVGSIDDAIAWLAKAERSPLLLLIDLHGSVMPLSDLARLAEVCEPSVQVIALGERNDVGLFRSLLRIGVRDYLVKPLTVDLLKRTVDMSAGKVNQVVQTRAGKVIAFVGSRGGVGTTTIAVHLVRHLADDTHRRVAYVDLNVHGGAGNCLLGLAGNNGLVDVLQNVHRLDPAYVERTMVPKGPRLFVLSSELGYGEPRPFDDGSLARVLELLTDSFHYVVLDIGDRADPLAGEAFDRANRVYVVADRSVHSTRETIRLTRHIEDRDNNPATSVLLNNPNAAASGKVQLADFLSAVGRSVLTELPFETRALAIAENVGDPLAGGESNAFQQGIVRIGSDLTGQQTAVQRGLLQRLRLRK